MVGAMESNKSISAPKESTQTDSKKVNIEEAENSEIEKVVGKDSPPESSEIVPEKMGKKEVNVDSVEIKADDKVIKDTNASKSESTELSNLECDAGKEKSSNVLDSTEDNSISAVNGEDTKVKEAELTSGEQTCTSNSPGSSTPDKQENKLIENTAHETETTSTENAPDEVVLSDEKNDEMDENKLIKIKNDLNDKLTALKNSGEIEVTEKEKDSGEELLKKKKAENGTGISNEEKLKSGEEKSSDAAEVESASSDAQNAGSSSKESTETPTATPTPTSTASESSAKQSAPKKTTTAKSNASPKSKFNSVPSRPIVLNESGRSTRSSINPDFAAKQRSFLNKVQNAYSSIKLLEAAGAMSSSESEEEEDSSESSYHTDDDMFNEINKSCGDKDKKSAPANVNGVKRKKDEIVPVPANGPKITLEPDKTPGIVHTPPNPPAKPEPGHRKRKASSAECIDLDNEDSCSGHVPSPAKTSPPVALKRPKIVRLDETGKEIRTQIPCDVYCWFCHREGATIMCKSCPRVYHIRCLTTPPPEHAPGRWVCPLCLTVLKAESTDNRSRAMKMLTLDQFCLLLTFTVSRMKAYSGSEAFCKPVDPKEFPMYSFYIVNPMDISQLERNIKNRLYGSTEAFLADASWIVHNCAIFNSLHNKLTYMAKQMLKICRQEIADIENCPDCYLHAHSGGEEWFVEPCRKPHLLVWAKLKGFPFWPAKAMQCNTDGMVDVRFFGAHDRAWVPAKECILYTRTNTCSKKKKKSTLDSCIEELEKHVTKLEACFGKYVPPIGRVYLNPSKFDDQLNTTLPEYNYAEAMKKPLSFSNEELMKAAMLAAERIPVPIATPPKRPSADSAVSGHTEGNDICQPISEEDEVRLSDSLQSDKEEAPNSKPRTKRTRLTRESEKKGGAKNSEDKNAQSSTGSKSEDATKAKVAKRETRKSCIVDRLHEKLALLDEEQPKSWASQTSENADTADKRSQEPMDADGPQSSSTEMSDVSTSVDNAESPAKKRASPVKTESQTETPTASTSESQADLTPSATDTNSKAPGSAGPLLTEIKLEKEDETPEKTVTRSAAASESNTSVSSQSESSASIKEPIAKRRSTPRTIKLVTVPETITTRQRASAAAAKTGKTTPNSKATPTTPTTAAAAAAAATPPVETGKRLGRRDSKNNAAAVAVASSEETDASKKKKTQGDETPIGKSDSPKKTANNQSNVQVPPSASPQERFTARKSVPGGTMPKNVSLMKAQPPLPPSMSASPTIMTSTVRLQTTTATQPLQVFSSPILPSLTVSPMVALSNSSATATKTTTVIVPSSVKSSSASSSTVSPSTAIVTSSLGSAGSIILSTIASGNSTSQPVPVSVPVANVTVVANANASAVVTEGSANIATIGVANVPSSAKTTVASSGPLSATMPSFVPSSAGPHAAAIRTHAAKLTEYFCGMIEDSIKDIGGKGNASATIKALQLEFERLNWQHTQEMSELRHNTSLVIEEIKKTFETQKALAIKEAVAARSAAALKEKETAVIATKRKQWCAFCLKEALFYCCWNTSYCDYSCQQKHWPVHSMYCTQNENCDDSSSPNIPSGGASVPKPVFIKNPNSSNGSAAATAPSASAICNTVNSTGNSSGGPMPIMTARSSATSSSNANSPAFLLSNAVPSSSSAGSIIVPSRPTLAASTSSTNPRSYVIPSNVRIRPNAPGQKVVLRQGGKATTSPGGQQQQQQQQQVVFFVNNQKGKNP